MTYELITITKFSSDIQNFCNLYIIQIIVLYVNAAYIFIIRNIYLCIRVEKRYDSKFFYKIACTALGQYISIKSKLIF